VSRLSGYILRTVLAYTGLVALVLLALGALFLFIGQQDDIGTGSYTASQAMIFVALNLPAYMVQLLPIAALIGTLLGLGNLATGSELVVMRASGVSTGRIALWLALAGLLLAGFTFVLGEYVAPPLGKYAKQMKVFSKYNEFSLAGSRGTWVRDGDTIISVEQQSASTRYGGVRVFRFSGNRELQSVGRAAAASVAKDNQWELEDYVETSFSAAGAQSRKVASERIGTALSPEFLGLAVLEPDAMGLGELRTYVEHLEHNRLDSTRYRIAFWSRIARLVALVLVVMLALPFCLGSLRSAGQGARSVIGILIGAGFVLLSQTLESGGQLFGLPSQLIAWLPTALLAALTATLLWRTR
jgi:lipopolysaccharide export system permease protein